MPRDLDRLGDHAPVEDLDAVSEHAERGLRRGSLMAGIVGAGFVLVVAVGGVVYDRVYPPKSPPDAATTQELHQITSQLEQIIAGKSTVRDGQYRKTVFALCTLARDDGESAVFDDPEYDCATVLSGPPPSAAPSSSSAPTTSSPASPSGSGSNGSATPGVRLTDASPAPTVSTTASPPPSTSSSSAEPSTARPVPSLLCTGLPVVSVCIGG